MFGFLPPSSSATRFTVSAELIIKRLPVAKLPVNETMSTPGCVLSGPPATAPAPSTKFATPAGKPASVNTSIIIEVVEGVNSLGLMTNVQPVAIAGAIFHEACNRG